jgi:hypothetical protein
MAPFAARSARIRKLGGFTVTVAELCSIAGAACLNPSFPIFLCFGLWQYLWRKVQKSSLGYNHRLQCKKTPSAANLPSLLSLVRTAAFVITLMLPAEGWAQVPDPQPGSVPVQQDKTSSSNGTLFPQATAKTGVTSADVLKQEERQRILGVVPNFNTVESSAGVPSLSPGQKFHLMYKSSVDPFVFVADGFVAGLSQARNSNPGFGQGAEGYFKRFGASYLDTADGNLWGNAILPILFKEDPRYFRLGSGTLTHRFLYSAATTVWCKRDDGARGLNYANVLGNFISGSISNAYYPAADRGFGQTIDGALTVTAEGVIGAEFVEFWPDISRYLFKKHQAAP